MPPFFFASISRALPSAKAAEKRGFSKMRQIDSGISTVELMIDGLSPFDSSPFVHLDEQNRLIFSIDDRIRLGAVLTFIERSHARRQDIDSLAIKLLTGRPINPRHARYQFLVVFTVPWLVEMKLVVQRLLPQERQQLHTPT